MSQLIPTNSDGHNSTPVSLAERTQTFTFDFESDSIESNWFQPEMAEIICAVCGQQCKEKGLPLCVNGNPYCG
jgi:hypothetical protein